MNGLMRGLVLGGVQVLLVAGVGAKFLLDRVNYPKVWVQTAPYDPDLPIRGRYVRLMAVVTNGSPESSVELERVRLAVHDSRLVAMADQAGSHWLNKRSCGAQSCWVLTEPLAYFIPEHVPDPSIRASGEELWVEVTVPPTGAPRPIRLGVKKNGRLEPLTFR